jgi:hypothetical protein
MVHSGRVTPMSLLCREARGRSSRTTQIEVRQWGPPLPRGVRE